MKVVAIMVADDLVLAMRNIRGMQNLLNKVEADGQRERYIFSKSKTTVKIINSKYQSKLPARQLSQWKPLETSVGLTHG